MFIAIYLLASSVNFRRVRTFQYDSIGWLSNILYVQGHIVNYSLEKLHSLTNT